MNKPFFTATLHSSLSPEILTSFLNDPDFWNTVWSATTMSQLSATQFQYQSSLKIGLLSLRYTALLKTPILENDSTSHTWQCSVFLNENSYAFEYRIHSLESGASVVLSVSQHPQSPFKQAQLKLILKHHQQQLQDSLGRYQHDHLFASMQNPEATQSLNKLEPESGSKSVTVIQDAAKNLDSQDSANPASTPVNNSFSSPPTNSTSPSSSSALFPFLPQQPIPPPTTGFALWRSVMQWQQKMKPIFVQEHLTQSQWLLLYYLVELSTEKNSLTGAQLVALTGLHKMVVSDLTNKLVHKHFLRKLKLPHNKKEYQLQVTAEGKTAAFAVFGRLQQAEKAFFAELNPELRKQLGNI